MPILSRARAMPMVRTIQTHAVFLVSEHVFDRRAHSGAFCIGPGGPLGHWPAARLLAVDVADEQALLCSGPGVFHAPAGVPILLANLGRLGLPALGKAPVPDRGLFRLGVALPRGQHDRRIDHPGLDQPLAEQPHRRGMNPGVGDCVQPMPELDTCKNPRVIGVDMIH